MKKLILISALLLIASNGWGSNHENLKDEHITCIAALSLARDDAESKGEMDKFRFLTTVQNNIYLDLPDFPKYSKVSSKKIELANSWNEISEQCINIWKEE